MLCCVGLFAGLAVGQYLGGIWTLVAPGAGFVIGLAGDMKVMGGCWMPGHRHDGTHDGKPGEPQEPVPAHTPPSPENPRRHA